MKTENVAQGEAPESSNIHAIQAAIWPQARVSTETEVHFRLNGPVGLSLGTGGLKFASGGRLSTDTYYNIFNLGKWRRHCGVMPLELSLWGKGKFQLAIWLVSRDKSPDQLFCEVITLDGLLRQPVDAGIKVRPDSLIYFELLAFDEGEVEDFAWSSTALPRRDPKLVLSVTTFRREAEIESTARRFRNFLERSGLEDHIRMVIVDNGRSADVENGGGVTVIPNQNFGGAGGFSRGLIEAKDTGATHCLFMDDDASIHMEAISRSWWFLAYALDDRTAVAGAMINADYRWELWENGAHFERGCKPHYKGLDLRESELVINMECETTASPPSGFYAGWWFFAFPISQVVHLPFPFFVRGDDVSFSLANDFEIVTLPGVGSIQESFTDKASPLTWYLDFRSHLVHHLSLPNQQISWWKLQKMFVSFYLRTILRFHYDSLAAVNLAIEDVLKGPRFFEDNIDLSQRRSVIKELTTTETWRPVDFRGKVRLGRCPRIVRALFLMTLNGHLLPFSSFFGSRLIVPSCHRENHREIYGAQEITYLNSDRTSAYVVRRQQKRFWKESTRLLKNSLLLRKKHSALLDEWKDGYTSMTSYNFWRRKLEI